MPLARCQAPTDAREIIKITFDLHHKLHDFKLTEIRTIDFFLNLNL